MIIGFVGYMGSGKTTASDYLVEKYNYTKVGFKDALVAEMRENFPRTMEQMVGMLNSTDWDGMDIWTVEKLFRVKPPIFRALMQEYGTEVRRSDNPYYWTLQWARTVRDMENVVCDDVRFLNEAECLRNAGGKIIRIVRTDIDGAGSHSSEKEQESIEAHFTISVGKGELEKLYKLVDEICQ